MGRRKRRKVGGKKNKKSKEDILKEFRREIVVVVFEKRKVSIPSYMNCILPRMSSMKGREKTDIEARVKMFIEDKGIWKWKSGMKDMLKCIKVASLNKIWKTYFPEFDKSTNKAAKIEYIIKKFYGIPFRTPNEEYVISDRELDLFKFQVSKPPLSCFNNTANLAYEHLKHVFEYLLSTENQWFHKYALINRYFFKFCMINTPLCVISNQRLSYIRDYALKQARNVYFCDRSTLSALFHLAPSPSLREQDYSVIMKKLRSSTVLQTLNFQNVSPDSFIRAITSLTRYPFPTCKCLQLPNSDFQRTKELRNQITRFTHIDRNFPNLESLASPKYFKGINGMKKLEKIVFPGDFFLSNLSVETKIQLKQIEAICSYSDLSEVSQLASCKNLQSLAIVLSRMRGVTSFSAGVVNYMDNFPLLKNLDTLILDICSIRCFNTILSMKKLRTVMISLWSLLIPKKQQENIDLTIEEEEEEEKKTISVEDQVKQMLHLTCTHKRFESFFMKFKVLKFVQKGCGKEKGIIFASRKTMKNGVADVIVGIENEILGEENCI